jgi:hypothetical protein
MLAGFARQGFPVNTGSLIRRFPSVKGFGRVFQGSSSQRKGHRAGDAFTDIAPGIRIETRRGGRE